MSLKIAFFYKWGFLFQFILMLFSLCGCDPCRQLAEQICRCQSEETSRQCITELNLASQHEYFKEAKNQSVCEQALLECSCPDFNNQNDSKCGQYRKKLIK
jgi:hypothetical protein